jgi:hypothetical protein
MKRQIIRILRKIVKNSSKRTILLALTFLIVAPLCFIYTNYENFEFVLAELLTFLSFLAGGNIYESIKKNNNHK